jgi:uncharacterized protein
MLEPFLDDPRWAADAVPYRELRGFLFAVLNGPELIPPSEWVPEVFGGVEPQYESAAQAESVLKALMALNNEVVAPLPAAPPGPPPGVVFLAPALANFDDAAPLAAWARGFVRGYAWIEDSWDGIPEEFGSVIAALGFFSSKRFAVEVFKAPASRLEDLAAATLDLLPEAAVEYQRVGRSVSAAMAETDASPD